MVKIENKTVTLKTGQEVTYKELCLRCNDVLPEKGWTSAEQKKSLRVDTAFENIKEDNTIDIEDADFEYLQMKVATMPWAIKDQALVDFSEYIAGLKK